MFQSKRDLLLMSGDFLYEELPKDKIWLNKYFHSKKLQRFVVFYLTFEEYILDKKISSKKVSQQFLDHTGIKYSITDLIRYISMIRFLQDKLHEAEKKKDLDQINLIKSGKYDNIPFRR